MKSISEKKKSYCTRWSVVLPLFWKKDFFAKLILHKNKKLYAALYKNGTTIVSSVCHTSRVKCQMTIGSWNSHRLLEKVTDWFTATVREQHFGIWHVRGISDKWSVHLRPLQKTIIHNSAHPILPQGNATRYVVHGHIIKQYIMYSMNYCNRMWMICHMEP